MTTALWNIKSSSRSYCAEFAHSWPHLLLGYPVERHDRLGPPRQRGFPSRETLSRQWEMLLLLLLMLLSCVWSVTHKDSRLKRIYGDICCCFFSFHMFVWKSVSPMERLLLSLLRWHTLFQLTHTNINLSFFSPTLDVFQINHNPLGSALKPAVKINLDE